MKTGKKAAAAVLGGLMALSVTACGAMPPLRDPYLPDQFNSPELRNETEVYRYSPMPDNKASVRRRVDDRQKGRDCETREHLKDAGRALTDGARDAGRDMKDAAEDAGRDLQRAGRSVRDRADRALGDAAGAAR